MYRPEAIVYDLYTGTGTIGLYLAKNVKQVIGIDYVEAAILDAKENEHNIYTLRSEEDIDLKIMMIMTRVEISSGIIKMK